MSEKKKTGKPKKRDPNTIEISKLEGEMEKDTVVAQTFLRPTVLAAATIKAQYAERDEFNINALIHELNAQVALVHGGNLGRAEAMLVTQAHTLDALFAELVGRSRINMGQYFTASCKYMNLAFRAQSQCRATLEALAEIKNPRPYIQNNKAQYQQVNNGEQPQPKNELIDQYAQARAHAGENSKSTNGLLEDKRHETEWLDTGAPETAGGNDKDLEAVGAIDRAKDE